METTRFFVAQYIVMGAGLTSSRTWMKNPTSRTPWISIESNDDGSKLVCTLSIRYITYLDVRKQQ